MHVQRGLLLEASGFRKGSNVGDGWAVGIAVQGELRRQQTGVEVSIATN